jgi:hypothetical protein
MVFIIVSLFIIFILSVLWGALPLNEFLPQARGKDLDRLGDNFNVKRKKWERDYKYRSRLNNVLDLNKRNMHMTTVCDTAGEDDVVFVVQHDPECRSVSKLKDIDIGERFIFMGKTFIKVSDLGWHFGICNIKSDSGESSHIHPSTNVSLIQ